MGKIFHAHKFFSSEEPEPRFDHSAEGQTVELRFDMPEEVVDEAAAEWGCTGQVLKVEAVGRLPIFHVGVRFDCYEVARPNGTTTIRIDLNSLRSDPAS
jgi:hypothetical protein